MWCPTMFDTWSIIVLTLHNNICSIFYSFRFVLFADSTSINAHSNTDILYSEANIELTKLCNWFCHNRLSLSTGQNTVRIIL